MRGSTGEGHKEVWLHPRFPLSDINYVFIKNDKDVRAWLLSNTVLEHPLDLLVYCHYRYTPDRVATPLLRRHNYLPENMIANWAWQAEAPTGIQAPRKEVRPDSSPANGEGNQANPSPLFLLVSSSSSSDVSDAGDRCEAISGTAPSPVADPTEFPHFHIPLAIQSPSKMNTNHGCNMRGCGGQTPKVKVRKHEAPSDSEDWSI